MAVSWNVADSCHMPAVGTEWAMTHDCRLPVGPRYLGSLQCIYTKKKSKVHRKDQKKSKFFAFSMSLLTSPASACSPSACAGAAAVQQAATQTAASGLVITLRYQENQEPKLANTKLTKKKHAVLHFFNNLTLPSFTIGSLWKNPESIILWTELIGRLLLRLRERLGWCDKNAGYCLTASQN